MKSLSILLFLSLLFATSSAGQGVDWPYDPIFKPVSQQGVINTFRNPKVSFNQRRVMLSRAGVNGWLEAVVNECARQLKQNPQDSLARSFYCYALFIANDPSEYKPQDKQEWERQQDRLFSGAAYAAQDLIKGNGAKISFCWQTLAYVNLMGYVDVAKGIERAEKALQLDSRDPFAHRLLAMAYLKTGETQNLEKALEHARRASALQPKAQRPYDYQALSYFRQKKYVAAHNALKKSYALRPPEYRDAKFLGLYEAWAKYEASQQAKTKPSAKSS